MYKREIEQLSVEKKYSLEKMIEEYRQIAYELDFGGLLEDAFRKTFLDSSEISYLYKALYLPIDEVRELINNFDESTNISLIDYLKNIFLNEGLNIYTNNGKYSDGIITGRIEDVEQIDSYKKEIEVQRTLRKIEGE